MKRWMWILAGSALLAACILCGAIFSGKKPVSVTTKTLSLQTVYRTVSCTGTVTPLHSERLSVGIPAVITATYVKQGDRVTAGTPLLSYRALTESDIGGNLGNYFQEAASILDNFYALVGNEMVLSAAEYYAATGELPSYFKDFYLPADQRPSGNPNNGVLCATMDGTVTSLSVQAGDRISGLLPSVCVSDMESLVVTLDIPESYAMQIRPDLPVNISGVAFGNSVHAAKILEVLPSVKKTGGILTKPEIFIQASAVVSANPPLMNGLSVSACIFLETVEQAVVVPYAAIEMDATGQEYVFVCRDGVVEKVALTYLFESADGVVTRELFTGEETVILHPDSSLKEGMAVTCNGVKE